MSNVCDKLNLGLTLLFTVELGINMFAHWFSKFWESGYSCSLSKLKTYLTAVIKSLTRI